MYIKDKKKYASCALAFIDHLEEKHERLIKNFRAISTTSKVKGYYIEMKKIC